MGENRTGSKYGRLRSLNARQERYSNCNGDVPVVYICKDWLNSIILPGTTGAVLHYPGTHAGENKYRNRTAWTLVNQAKTMPLS